jgi:alpha-glucosidase (family GH31 glycosyl hydrolase)
VAGVRNVYVDHPTDAAQYAVASTQYQLGDAIIAAPITWLSDPTTNATKAAVVLPGGVADVWSNWNGTQSWPGGAETNVVYGLGDIPLFVNASQMVPLQTNGSVWQAYADPLVWSVWPGQASGGGFAYEDDSESLAYESGAGATAAATYTWTGVQSGGDVGGTVVTVTHAGWVGTYAGAPATRSTGVQVRLVDREGGGGGELGC